MPPTLTSHQPRSYLADLKTLCDPLHSPPNRSRADLLRSILARSVRIRITRDPNGIQLPLKIRPALVVLNVITLVVLGLLGFHPKASHLPISDKLLHFVCFYIATLLFYCIWDVDTEVLRSAPSEFWKKLPILLTFYTCFIVGGIGSEIVQGLLPYKIFDWADILANICGCALGLWTSWHVEKRIREKRELKRLYTPLDFDAAADGPDGYGDHDDDEQGDLESGLQRNGASTSIFDDDEQEQTPPIQKQQQQPPQTQPSRTDLFSIDDEDGDAEAEHNVWKSTT